MKTNIASGVLSGALLAIAICAAVVSTSAADDADGAAEATVAIPLSDTLRFIIQPTILGLVPPQEPSGFGEVFVRIIEAGRNTISLHYEIKEEIPLTEENSADHRPGQKTETRIRRGEIFVNGIRDADTLLPPLYWGDGELTTKTSLLWLSREAFDTLSRDDSCDISVNHGGTLDSPAAAELETAISELMDQRDAAAGEAVTLELLDEVRYPCAVNGRRTWVAALYARDSLGLAEYWVLDDPVNPLVLKLTYALGDAREADDMSFIRKGGGYAVTSIDFSARR